jgi:hypothetical protein
MPSITDIPLNLLDPAMAFEFAAWLGSLPLDQPTTRALVKLWKAYTGANFTPAHWQHLRNTQARHHG